MYDQIILDIDDPVATITLNRPDRMNGWTPRMGTEFRHAVAQADASEDVFGIVVTGAGRAFCAGADLGTLTSLSGGGGTFSDDETTAEDLTVAENPSWPTPDSLKSEYGYLLACRKPVIAAINGAVAGMAVPISLCCDLRFMAEDAPLVVAFAQRGLIAEWGVSWLLPRLVGPAVALDLLWTPRRITGAEAARLGVVNAAMPADQVLEHSRQYIRDLSERSSPTSIAVMKRQVYEHYHRGLGDSEREAQQLMLDSFQRPDFKEGVQSFMQKRPPSFARVPERP